ncbi:MAG TPA: hypothetical protein VNU00_01905, partial [Candidatus Binataceae bacterium]|nr:hypothetical protein [Candidatus Binataceae bacterium]
LAFCLNAKIDLGKEAGKVLSTFDDDTILLEALDMRAEGLLPAGFSEPEVSRTLRATGELDKEHWLIAYESVRQGFMNTCELAVKGNSLFSDLLNRQITFYRRKLPPYALVLYPGGAPNWTRAKWVTEDDEPQHTPIIELVKSDLAKLSDGRQDSAIEMTVEELMELHAEALPHGEAEDVETAEYGA